MLQRHISGFLVGDELEGKTYLKVGSPKKRLVQWSGQGREDSGDRGKEIEATP